MAKRRKLSNPLAMALMATLAERPMHPYEMASVLRFRGKEHSIKINYGSLYTVVQNLEKYGFIEVTEVQRHGRRPERTLYGLTEAGHHELHDWLAEMVQVPEKEYPRFEAALSMIMALPPDEAIRLLEERLRQITVQLTGLRAMLKQLMAEEGLPRLLLIESEYAAAMQAAEADWIEGIVRELKDGSIAGVDAWRTWHATGTMPEEWAEFEESMRERQGPSDTSGDRPGDGPGDGEGGPKAGSDLDYDTD